MRDGDRDSEEKIEMHEWGITDSVIKEILRQASENKLENVERVCLSIGEESDITADSLKFCFECLAKGTMLEKAGLEIKKGNGKGITIESIEIDR